MSEALRLPARPSLEQYRKLAKDFQEASRRRLPGAIRDWAAAWLTRAGENAREADSIEEHWQELIARRPKLAAGKLTDAQYFVARLHGFASWPLFAAHVEAVARETSGTARFEAAVDAIVSGDIRTLERLLRDEPSLVRARSTREHAATLLHYVSANGVEDFRQKTPPNIVDIARLLLDAGADVNAVSNSYGPNDTTFMLTATSCHPEDAGVQIPLLELLLDRGAAIDWPPGSSTVNACLHNGRGPAADFCAARGAPLDLEGAAGVGRLDIMRTFVNDDGSLAGGATRQQMLDGFVWACQFGRIAAVEFLLDRGVDVGASLRDHGNTGLHAAAYGGHPDIVTLLLGRGAAINARDTTFDGTPLGWALYCWGNARLDDEQRERYYEVVATLVRAGATVDPEWLTENAERDRASRKLRADPRMMAALGG